MGITNPALCRPWAASEEDGEQAKSNQALGVHNLQQHLSPASPRAKRGLVSSPKDLLAQQDETETLVSIRVSQAAAAHGKCSGL